jgi:F-type H+-transporting ATPase subunit delta
MSAGTWDRELGDLAGRLAQEGAIAPAQAELLQRLAAEVSALTRSQKGRPEAVARTAVPLTDSERRELEKLLAARFATARPVTYEVDPALLGGVWLRVGDRVVDGSLRGRLDSLRRQLTVS